MFVAEALRAEATMQDALPSRMSNNLDLLDDRDRVLVRVWSQTLPRIRRTAYSNAKAGDL